MDNLPTPPSPDHRWTVQGPNILSSNNLGRIQQALSEDWIVGAHFYYCAGRGGEPIAFDNFDAMKSLITASRPGDLFILWSIAELRRKGRLLADCRRQQLETSNDSLLSTADLARIRTYLVESNLNEILCIVSGENSQLKVFWSDLDSSDWEPFLDACRHAAVPGGALCVLPFTKLDSPEFYLVNAKRPNENGETLLGGAY